MAAGSDRPLNEGFGDEQERRVDTWSGISRRLLLSCMVNKGHVNGPSQDDGEKD